MIRPSFCLRDWRSPCPFGTRIQRTSPESPSARGHLPRRARKPESFAPSERHTPYLLRGSFGSCIYNAKHQYFTRSCAGLQPKRQKSEPCRKRAWKNFGVLSEFHKKKRHSFSGKNHLLHKTPVSRPVFCRENAGCMLTFFRVCGTIPMIPHIKIYSKDTG